MSKDFGQIANNVIVGLGLLPHGAPQTMKAFGSLATAATASTGLDTNTKKLMALANGIAVHCDGCITYPMTMVPSQEVVQTISLAIYRGGGPAAVYAGDALRAYDQFNGHTQP